MFSWKKEYSVSEPDDAIQHFAQREDNGFLNLTTFLIRSENFEIYYIPQAVTTPGC